MMLVELIVSALVALFVAIVVIGHAVLAAAIIQCVGGDPAGGPAEPSINRRRRGIGGAASSAKSMQTSSAGHGAVTA
jgi:hypothetical protein